ncbi:MAG: endolytic transglycosylase MltG [Clostridiales bacterium]|nr:endolytic transglycosylase MltG [Clostridiales bacterium]
MKLKYYMRGLGIGIIVTTVVLSIANKKVKLSDAEIITQARELGMVMKEEANDDNLKQVLEKSLDKDDDIIDTQDDRSDDNHEDEMIVEKDSQNWTEEVATEDTKDNELTAEDTAGDETRDNADSVIAGEETLEEGEDTLEQVTTEGTITFTIIRGMSSRQVSELLKEKGLIEDALDFDNYIKGKGKATVIRIGTYTLPKGADYSMILNAIT